MLQYRLHIAFTCWKEVILAISHLLPRKTMRNKTRQQSMAERHDYDQKPEKTNDGELVSSYMCSAEVCCKGGILYSPKIQHSGRSFVVNVGLAERR